MDLIIETKQSLRRFRNRTLYMGAFVEVNKKTGLVVPDPDSVHVFNTYRDEAQINEYIHLIEAVLSHETLHLILCRDFGVVISIKLDNIESWGNEWVSFPNSSPKS